MEITNQPTANTDHLAYSKNFSDFEVEMKLHSGEKVPVKFLVTGDVINETSVTHTVEVAKTVFLKFDQNGPGFKVSENDPWQNFETIFTGQLDASIGKNDCETKPTGQIHLDLNVRN